MNFFRTRFFVRCCLLVLVGVVFTGNAQTEVIAAERKVQRILLLGQGPDGHPFGTHEYNTAMRIVITCLKSQNKLQIIAVSADEPWSKGPELLDGADGAVIFLSQGAKWLQKDPARLQAFQRLGQKGRSTHRAALGNGNQRRIRYFRLRKFAWRLSRRARPAV